MNMEQKMWIVVTDNGMAYIGRKGSKVPEGTDATGCFWNWGSRSLAYIPLFQDKRDASRFARKARKSRTVRKAEIIELETYKGELD